MLLVLDPLILVRVPCVLLMGFLGWLKGNFHEKKWFHEKFRSFWCIRGNIVWRKRVKDLLMVVDRECTIWSGDLCLFMISPGFSPGFTWLNLLSWNKIEVNEFYMLISVRFWEIYMRTSITLADAIKMCCLIWGKKRIYEVLPAKCLGIPLEIWVDTPRMKCPWSAECDVKPKFWGRNILYKHGYNKIFLLIVNDFVWCWLPWETLTVTYLFCDINMGMRWWSISFDAPTNLGCLCN